MPQPIKSRLSTASTFHVSKFSIFVYGLFQMNTPKSCTERVALTRKLRNCILCHNRRLPGRPRYGLGYLTENGF